MELEGTCVLDGPGAARWHSLSQRSVNCSIQSRSHFLTSERNIAGIASRLPIAAAIDGQ